MRLILLCLFVVLVCASFDPIHNKALDNPRIQDPVGLKFKTIAQVNTYVNKIRYHPVDEWTIPNDFLINGGDCKGFVLLKRQLILENHLAEATQILLVQVRSTKEFHAILDVQGKALDNRHPYIQSIHSKAFNQEYLILGAYDE